jgi:predicted nucleic acid-binding protein
MKRSRGSTRSFLLDNNVFVAAIAHPKRATGTLGFILHMIADPSLRLAGNIYLAEEMIRYTEVFPSETATLLIEALASKMELIAVEGKYLKICRGYLGTSDQSDITHAATCLNTGSTLISDDHHFDRIRDEGIIEVWTTKKAIDELLSATRATREHDDKLSS